MKYLADGTEVSVVREFDDGAAIITRTYEYEDYYDNGVSSGTTFEEVEGVPYYVEAGALFDKPPTAKLHETISNLNKDVSKKREELRAAQAGLNDARNEAAQYESLLQRVRDKHDLLKSLDLYLSGKVTHVVEYGHHGTPKIIAAGDRDSRSGSAAAERKLKLISFSGGVNYRNPEDAGWLLHHYSDGSGNSSRPCIPCSNEADAIEHAKEQCRILLRKTSRHQNNHLFPGIAEACDRFGVEKPEWLMTYMAEYEKEQSAKNREKRNSKIQKLEAELADLKKNEQSNAGAEA